MHPSLSCGRFEDSRGWFSLLLKEAALIQQAVNEQWHCPMTGALAVGQTDISDQTVTRLTCSCAGLELLKEKERCSKNVLLQKSGFNLPKIQILFCNNRSKAVEDIMVLEPRGHCWVHTRLGDPIRHSAQTGQPR